VKIGNKLGCLENSNSVLPPLASIRDYLVIFCLISTYQATSMWN